MRMSKYIISGFLFCLLVLNGSAQTETSVDSLKVPVKFGLRLGADLTSLGRTTFSNDYKGFEILGDYRLTERLYAAGELEVPKRQSMSPILILAVQGNTSKLAEISTSIEIGKEWTT